MNLQLKIETVYELRSLSSPESLFGQDGVHGDVVGLGEDGGKAGVLIADADFLHMGKEGQGAVVVAAAEAEAVACIIMPDQRHDNDLRLDDFGPDRFGDAPTVVLQSASRKPQMKL